MATRFPLQFRHLFSYQQNSSTILFLYSFRCSPGCVPFSACCGGDLAVVQNPETHSPPMIFWDAKGNIGSHSFPDPTPVRPAGLQRSPLARGLWTSAKYLSQTSLVCGRDWPSRTVETPGLACRMEPAVGIHSGW